MKYRINKTNYCDFNIFEDNKLAHRYVVGSVVWPW